MFGHLCALRGDTLTQLKHISSYVERLISCNAVTWNTHQRYYLELTGPYAKIKTKPDLFLNVKYLKIHEHHLSMFESNNEQFYTVTAFCTL